MSLLRDLQYLPQEEKNVGHKFSLQNRKTDGKMKRNKLRTLCACHTQDYS